jgi:hypothetical protein
MKVFIVFVDGSYFVRLGFDKVHEGRVCLIADEEGDKCGVEADNFNKILEVNE